MKGSKRYKETFKEELKRVDVLVSGKLIDMLENSVSTSYLFSFRNLLHFVWCNSSGGCRGTHFFPVAEHHFQLFQGEILCNFFHFVKILQTLKVCTEGKLIM